MKHCLVIKNLWKKDMLESLGEKTQHEFTLIDNPNDLQLSSLQALSPRFLFFPHWSHKIGPEIVENFECVMFHMTDLPYGRGGSPLQNLILAGEKSTKISAFRCSEQFDAGPIYLQRSLSLEGSAQSIYERANSIIENMIVEIIRKEPVPVEQQGQPTHFKRRTPAQSNLQDVSEAAQCYDMIRMLDADDYPHAFLATDALQYEFRNAVLQGDEVHATVTIKRKK